MRQIVARHIIVQCNRRRLLAVCSFSYPERRGLDVGLAGEINRSWTRFLVVHVPAQSCLRIRELWEIANMMLPSWSGTTLIPLRRQGRRRHRCDQWCGDAISSGRRQCRGAAWCGDAVADDRSAGGSGSDPGCHASRSECPDVLLNPLGITRRNP